MLLIISFQILADDIYMPDVKRASITKKTLEDYFRSPQSDTSFDCPVEEYDIAWPLNLGVKNLLSKVVTGTLKFTPWCDGQEGTYQFQDAYRGGFISNTAEVDPTAIIGPMASICDNAKVKGFVKVCGRTQIRGEVILKGNFKIYGNGSIESDFLNR